MWFLKEVDNIWERNMKLRSFIHGLLLQFLINWLIFCAWESKPELQACLAKYPVERYPCFVCKV